MPEKLDYLNGRKFCVVFVKLKDPVKQRVQLQCYRGRASVSKGVINVVNADGAVFTVPGSATANVLPSDGSEILKDAEYFVLVRCDDSMEFFSQN